jgi:hypothetical protein
MRPQLSDEESKHMAVLPLKKNFALEVSRYRPEGSVGDFGAI